MAMGNAAWIWAGSIKGGRVQQLIGSRKGQ